MSMNIDKPLDDIIGEKRKSRAPRRGATRPTGQRKPSTGNASGNQPRGNGQAAAPAASAFGGVHVGEKIVISGLPTDVDKPQVEELMKTTIGPIKSCNLSYDSRGQFIGVATILFKKAENATRAYYEYNGRVVDGSRPMRVEIIVDPSRAAASQPLTARLGAPPAAAAAAPAKSRAAKSATVAAAGGSAVQKSRNADGAGAATGGRRGGAGGRRGGRGGRKGEDRPAATAESLDAEMSDWHAQGAAAPTA